MNHPLALIVTFGAANSAEKQRRPGGGQNCSSATSQILAVTLAGILGIACFIGLYLLKSALGINLFAGPSFMHELFYHLIR